ncbi:MAG TPA: hypothetical protein VLG09_00190 [Candidatus Saccharimonadales bacterium]|nr:hypothetical protein [Candidatus Saccharimonadales bacterium]
MHPTQHDILDSLRHGNSRRFNELLRDIAETSDNLTYHLKQLQRRGFIQSPSKGEYALNDKGIIYLNNNLELNHDLFPTVSCMLELHDPSGMILVMHKLKQPHLGSIYLPTFGVTSSQSLKVQIDSFLGQYHIVADHLIFRGLHRERSSNDDNLFVFDKFFVIFQGNFTSFDERVDGRKFMTTTLAKLLENPRLLTASRTVLSLNTNASFTEDTQIVL